MARVRYTAVYAPCGQVAHGLLQHGAYAAVVNDVNHCSLGFGAGPPAGGRQRHTVLHWQHHGNLMSLRVDDRNSVKDGEAIGDRS